MPDLTFQNWQDTTGAPEDAFMLDDDGKLVCDVGAVVGENITAMTSQKLTEFVYKLAKYSRVAQDEYNNPSGGTPVAAGSRINSFSTVARNTPTTTDAGVFSTANITVSARIPLNEDLIEAPLT